MSQLGFIGLGIMGKPMAGHLLAAGHPVAVYNRSSKSVAELAQKGAVACASCKEVGQRSDIVFLMVPDTADVETVLFGPNGLVEGLKSGSTVVDMSTISPVATWDIAKRLKDKGIRMLDAPVSGGQIGAEQATLTIMVGGEPSVYEEVLPFLKLFGKKITYIGGHGTGQICKAANQTVVAGTLLVISEALVLASKAGADPAKVREALLGGFAQSRILEVHGERMIKRNFQPGFRARLQQKDLNIVLQTARSIGVSMPATTLAQEMYNSLAAYDGADLDHSALVQSIERLAQHQLANSDGNGKGGI
jgi:2-hydroxy-3-oxopropionate reductase